MAETSATAVASGKEGGGEDAKEESGSSPCPAPEALMKHPLQNSWTLWFFKNDRTRSWEDNQRAIITFATVEDFWGLGNQIELASKMMTGCDYSLFKEGIKPMW